MITKKRWTDEENNILVQAITANPHNITEACRYAANRIEVEQYFSRIDL